MTRYCPTCSGVLPTRLKYCGDSCKPRCSVEGCDNPTRKRGWCAAHYAQQRNYGRPPEPFKYTWAERGPCLNCGKDASGYGFRRFCSSNCRVHYRNYNGPRPTEKRCALCCTPIDLTEVGERRGQRKSSVKLCRKCRRAYREHGFTPHELAERDGTDCGICGEYVDLALDRGDSLMCASVDHVIPRARGGSHDSANLQLAHLICNMRKRDQWAVVPVSQGGGAGWQR